MAGERGCLGWRGNRAVDPAGTMARYRCAHDAIGVDHGHGGAGGLDSAGGGAAVAVDLVAVVAILGAVLQPVAAR